VYVEKRYQRREEHRRRKSTTSLVIGKANVREYKKEEEDVDSKEK